MNCIVIDDEPLAIQLLADYVQKTEGLTLIKTFSNPIKALQFINSQSIDLIFLDVQMPELSGIQLMKILNQQYQIILTTAYNSYAVEGFEYNVADYLMKPIAYDRFLIAIQKVQNRTQSSPQITPSIELPAANFIFVKSEYRVQKINLDEIIYLEGLGDYVAIHTVKGKILTLENMKHFERKLPQQDFMRVHKSFLVALSKIDYIERNRIVIQEKRIPVSDSYKKVFWKRIKGK